MGREREREEKMTTQELGVRKDSQWGLQSMRIRTDDLEVTELQEGPVGKGRARHIGKKGGRGRTWVKNITHKIVPYIGHQRTLNSDVLEPLSSMGEGRGREARSQGVRSRTHRVMHE